MATRYRKDLTFRDFDIAKAFKRGLLSLTGYNTPDGEREPFGDVRMGGKLLWAQLREGPRVPTWYLSGKGEWKLSQLKAVTENFLLITKRHFRHICNYIHYSEGEVLHVLYRMSMLAVHGPVAKPLKRFDLSQWRGDDYRECYLVECARMIKEGSISNPKRREKT